MATHTSILAWKIPWTEELGGLWSMGLQRVRHNRATNTLPFLLRFSLFHLELLHLTPKYLLKLVFKMSNKSLFIYKYKTSRAFLVVQW